MYILSRWRARWLAIVQMGSMWLRRRDADPCNTPLVWLKGPGPVAGRRVCLLVTWALTPKIDQHVIHLAKGWAAAGFHVILIVSRDDPGMLDVDQDLSWCNAIVVRKNVGYDFGAWASVIRAVPDLRRSALLAIANDSVFGPLQPLSKLVAKVEAHPADVVGLIESREHELHIQSFLIFFKSAALAAHGFESFWAKVRNGDRDWAIKQYELKLRRFFERKGVRTGAIFTAQVGNDEQGNATLYRWRELIEQGFPFIKVQLLRDNPGNVDLRAWRDLVKEHSYDPEFISSFLSLPKVDVIRSGMK